MQMPHGGDKERKKDKEAKAAKEAKLAKEAEARREALHLPGRGPDRPGAGRLALAGELVPDAVNVQGGVIAEDVRPGIPLTEKSVSDPQHFPDTVWLFRRAILDEWVERGNVTLTELVAHVVVHELAHHFGWSDEDVARIDRWWE